MESKLITRKTKILKASTLLNGALFLLSGITFCTQEKNLFGSLQLIAGFLNIYTGIRLKPGQSISSPRQLGLSSLNILVALSIAYDYYFSGSTYIHYVWILTAVFTFIAMIFQYKKK